MDFFTGTVTLEINGVYNGIYNLYNDYYENCHIEIDSSDLNIGDNTITLSYYDEEGEHPDNTTSFTITSIDTNNTAIDSNFPSYILTSDDTFTIPFYVETSTYAMVTEGTVSLYVNNEEYVLLKTADVKDEQLVVDTESLTSILGDIGYPSTLEFRLDYNNITQDYVSAYGFYYGKIVDIIPVNIIAHQVKIDDDEAVFNFKLTDGIHNNDVSNGKINISGVIHLGDVEEPVATFNGSTDVVDGTANITITNPNFNNYIGYEYSLYADYTDENKIYMNASRSTSDIIQQELTLEINDTEIYTNTWTDIPFAIKNSKGEILSFIYGGSLSFNYFTITNMAMN